MAATDILDADEALAAVNSSDVGDHTAELALAVSAVSDVIDAMCGPVVARTVTEVHGGGAVVLWPREAPVLSITSVTEFDGTTQTALTNESTFGTAATSTGFVVVPGGNWLERRTSGSRAHFTAGTVQVVYQAGRFANTADVDARFKYAAAAILRRLWKREGSAWAYTPDFFSNTDESGATTGSSFFRAVAPMVDEFLADERKPPAVA